MHTLTVYMIVFVGAGIGGALRHGVNVAFRAFGSGFPYGTLFINVVGALVMGLLAGLFALKFDLGQSWRLFFTTGILGGFTTFSAFGYETFALLRDGSARAALLNVGAGVAVGLAAVWAGWSLARVTWG